MDTSPLISPLHAHLHGLTPNARHQRYLELAHTALALYALHAPHPVYLQHNSGIAYRVEIPSTGDRFLLKIHVSVGLGAFPPVADEIEARLEWLAAVRERTNLVVQAPVPNREGKLITWIADPDLPDPLLCTLQHWVEGEPPQGDLTSQQTHRVGVMMATLHAVGGQDANLRLRTLPRFEATAIAGWAADLRTALPLGLLTADDLAIIETTGMQLQRWMAQIGDDPDMWGPIHGDLHHDNLLFYHDEVRPIDFDGLQIAPYYLDLGTMLYHIHYQGAVAQQALLAGYRQIRPLPDTYRRDLDAALICSAMGNLAFQITIPEQWTSVHLTRNLRQLVDAFCRSFIAETPIVHL